MKPFFTILLGAALVLAGAAFALLEIGVLLIADCGPDCQARGEQLVVGLLVLAGLGVAALGTWITLRGLRARRREG